MHVDLHSSASLPEAQAVLEHGPQDAPTVPAMAVQPPHTLGVVPAHESEFLSALQAHLRPQLPQLASFVAPLGVSALQPPHALGESPVQVSEFLSLEQVSLPQLPLPHAALGAPVSTAQPPQAFFPGSAHTVLLLSALHSYLPHCPHAVPGALASVPHPPQALALTPEHFTSVFSALHSQFPQEPHEELGALASAPHPPQAFLPGSLQVTDSLSVAHSYLPQSPQSLPGSAASLEQPPQALNFESEHEVVSPSGLQA